MTHNVCRTAFNLFASLATVLLAGVINQATPRQVSAAVLAYESTTGAQGFQTNSDSVLSNQFTVNSPIAVSQLGVYEPSFGNNAAGTLTNDVTVTIWSAGAGNSVIATETFTPTAPGTLAPGSYTGYLPITPVLLAPGNYTIGVYYPAGNGEPFGQNGHVPPGAQLTPTGGGLITYTNNNSLYGGGAGYPTNNDGNPNNFVAGSFAFAATPEPSSLILCGLGAIGLCIAARRRRKA